MPYRHETTFVLCLQNNFKSIHFVYCLLGTYFFEKNNQSVILFKLFTTEEIV